MTALLLAAVLVGDDWKDHRRDFTRDPVALVRDGKDVGGSALITASREGFRYFFATEENQTEFFRNPQRYEIQLGGACGKMGPLSGLGSTQTYSVVNGHLYVFASKGCRETFITGHESMLERDIVPPRPMKSAVDHGRALANKAIAWSGGEGLQRIGPIMSVRKYDYPTKSKTYKVTEEHAFALPGWFASNEDWETSSFGYIQCGPGAFTLNGKFDRPMAKQQIRSVERERNGTYLSALNAVAADGGLLIGSENRLNVYFDGSKASFELAEDGAIRSLTMPRRHGMLFGEVKHTFTGFTEFRGVKLPTGWKVEFDAKPAGEVSGLTWTAARADAFAIKK